MVVAMLVSKAMLPNPLTMSADTSLLDFIESVMDSSQTTAVVLGPDEALLGLVSVHDIFDRILPHYASIEAKLAGVIQAGYFEEKFTEFAHTKVSDIMTTKVDYVTPNDSLIGAVSLFVRNQRRTVPVIDSGKFVGTITRRSVLRHVLKLKR
ncbi:MAG: CBS domain-containing protein [Planctomycetota bacterium]|jgi:CBS domain-containing protein